MSRAKIIGIAGTNGAGKDTVGQLLASDYNFLFVSVSDILRDECRKRGLPIERKNLSSISAEWRRESGLGVLIDKAVEAFKESDSGYQGLAIASVRNVGEVDRVHDLGGKMIWVDADPKVRYERIKNANRGRGGEDNKTFEEFLSEEAAEMAQSGDEATLNMADVKTKADIFITNDGDLAKLKNQINQIS